MAQLQEISNRVKEVQRIAANFSIISDMLELEAREMKTQEELRRATTGEESALMLWQRVRDERKETAAPAAAPTAAGTGSRRSRGSSTVGRSEETGGSSSKGKGQ